jgi:hypothetical protein
MTTRRFKVGDQSVGTRKRAASPATARDVVTSENEFKGYTVHAGPEEPQYEIISDPTDHIAMHTSSALTMLRT